MTCVGAVMSNLEGRQGVSDSIMTVDEVAQFLRIHKTTVYRLLKESKIPAFRVGSDWRFNREEIDRWIQLPHNR
jgi:excisionase family DNA binding protein